ncbi:MAG: dCTP deaminase [Planctomycetia bacterium]|nr:dCTP deaminase [Planctomycetia bacterium]
MILSGLEIKKEIEQGNIIIDPFHHSRVNPNSYNLRLSDELLVYNSDVLDMKTKNDFRRITIPQEGYILRPGVLYLGRTEEYTETKCFVPMLEGRSSVGRLGLMIHVTAGFGDVGFSGYWTLEMQCVMPVRIYPYVEICQIYYHTLLGESRPYQSKKYQRNTGVQPSLMYMDFQEENSSEES